MNVSLGTIPEWQFTDAQVGRLLVGGQVFFYKDTDRKTLKPVFKDPAALIPYSNPIDLDGTGAVGLIYFLLDEPYYIELRDPTQPDPKQQVRTWPHYVPPAPGSTPPPITTEIDFDNFIINPQFYDIFDNTRRKILTSTLDEIQVAPGYTFKKSNTSGTDFIEIKDFDPTVDIEARPLRYLRYNCSSAASGETFKDLILEQFKGVQTFNNQNISFAIQVQSSTSTTIEIFALQHFGTGGSPSSDVETSIATLVLTPTWTKKEVNGFIIPSIAAKTLGTNKNDYFAILIRYPLNAVSDVDITNSQLNFGDKALDFAYWPSPKSKSESFIAQFPKVSDVLTDGQNYDVLSIEQASDIFGAQNQFNVVVLASPPVASAISMFTSAVPRGYLKMDGQTVVKQSYNRLYNVIKTESYFKITESSAEATVAANIVTVENTGNGAVPDIVDVDTGFVFNVPQQGTSVLPEISTITCNAASIIPDGAHFLYNTVEVPAKPLLLHEFYIYFIIDGVVRDPVVAGRKGIPIELKSTDSVTDVAVKLAAAMTPLTYQIPDTRGYFLRSWADGSDIDPDRLTRTFGDTVGSLQEDELESHIHSARGKPVNRYDVVTPGVENAMADTVFQDTLATGGNETRSINMAVMYCMKY